MKIKIQARHIALTSDLKAYVKRRIKYALGSRYDNIKHIVVTLSDVNGPRGGEDKRCKVHIALNGKQEIVIDDKQTHFHSAIDLATERASLALTRRIERLRNKARRFKNTFKSNKREKAENNSEYRPKNTEYYYGYDYDFGFSPRY